jgi:CheY-like chemotaxis protein
MKVLIADDNQINRLFLHGVLSQASFDVTEAADGSQALDLCRQQHFDLIFMDIRMPGMDGLEATAAIRSLSGFDPVSTRIIALTADLRLQQKQELLQLGFDACLAKPVDRQTLLDSIHDYPEGTSNPTDSTPTEVLDSDAALSAAGGNRELVTKLADMLDRELAKFLPMIDQAMADGNLDQARDMVHKIRGSAGYCGARVLLAEAERLELALANGEGSADGSALESFRTAAEATRRTLQAS